MPIRQQVGVRALTDARFFVHIVEQDGRVVDEGGHHACDLRALSLRLCREPVALHETGLIEVRK
jgi:hypothetical protein